MRLLGSRKGRPFNPMAPIFSFKEDLRSFSGPNGRMGI